MTYPTAPRPANSQHAHRHVRTSARGCAKGKVWCATVEPWRLLARYTERNEREYVVDTDGLPVVEDVIVA
jgi:hypothetical protein